MINTTGKIKISVFYKLALEPHKSIRRTVRAINKIEGKQYSTYNKKPYYVHYSNMYGYFIRLDEYS